MCVIHVITQTMLTMIKLEKNSVFTPLTLKIQEGHMRAALHVVFNANIKSVSYRSGHSFTFFVANYKLTFKTEKI